jgi:hypothetical protein
MLSPSARAGAVRVVSLGKVISRVPGLVDGRPGEGRGRPQAQEVRSSRSTEAGSPYAEASSSPHTLLYLRELLVPVPEAYKPAPAEPRVPFRV